MRVIETGNSTGEGRNRLLAIVAGIVLARKLAQYEGGKRVPATVSAISDAIRWAEELMDEIDRPWAGEAVKHPRLMLLYPVSPCPNEWHSCEVSKSKIVLKTYPMKNSLDILRIKEQEL